MCQDCVAMCLQCVPCCQLCLNCLTACENVRNNKATLRRDQMYLENNLPTLRLIIGRVRNKGNAANALEREWLPTADRAADEAVGILEKLGQVCCCPCCYLICWCNLGRRASVIRTNFEERLGQLCAQEILRSIATETGPVELQPGGDQTVFGMNRSFDEFWRQFENRDVQVIGIHGMIGIGKSTFLKRINAEFYDNRRGFDKVIFVSQSLDPNIDEAQRIQREIARRLGINNLDDNPATRMATLNGFLSSMNVVLLLDNLLYGEPLSSLGIPVPPAPARAADPIAAPDNQPRICKVVFTSRQKPMGGNIGAPVHEIELDLLSREDGRRLLKSKVRAQNPNWEAIKREQFDEHGETRTIEDAADRIADMCDGLPLALAEIGEHLQTLRETEEWRNVLRRLCKPEQASDGDPEGRVYNRLREAYDSLIDTQHCSEKRCFLYCSLFPKGHAIDENELKRHWTVEGYLGRVTGNWELDAYFNSAVSVIGKLKRAHLLSSSSDHQPSVKMNGQCHCVARWIERDTVGDENFGLSNENWDELSAMSEERRRQVRRIFFMSPGQGSLGRIDCPNLSTLVIRNNFGTRIEPGLFDSIQGSLQVLDLASCTLPSFQQNLRFPFSLRGNLYKMTNLLYLNLSHTNIQTFPFAFKNMTMLKFLDLSFTKHLIVNSLGNLLALTDLRLLNFYYCGPCENGQVGGTFLLLQDIEKLNYLGDLAVTISGNPAFRKLENFSKLNLIHSMVITNCDDAPLQFIATARKLKVLHVIHCSTLLHLAQDAITRGHCFENLTNVEIANCQNLTDLTWLKYAQALQSLKIANCQMLTQVINRTNTQPDQLPFVQLRTLELSDLLKLVRIFSQDLPFSYLESIIVRNCGQLETIPIEGNNDRIMWPLIECQKGWWDKMGNDHTKSRLRHVFRA